MNHITTVRRTIDGLRNATAFIMVESNWGNEAVHTNAWLKAYGFRNAVVMFEDRGSAGFRTSARSKHTQVESLQILLKKKLVRVHRDLVVCDDMYTGDEMKERMAMQLKGFMKVIEKRKKPYLQPKVYLTGKFGGNKDDLVLSLMLNVEAEHLFTLDRNKDYAQYKLQ